MHGIVVYMISKLFYAIDMPSVITLLSPKLWLRLGSALCVVVAVGALGVVAAVGALDVASFPLSGTIDGDREDHQRIQSSRLIIHFWNQTVRLTRSRKALLEASCAWMPKSKWARVKTGVRVVVVVEAGHF